ncbi:retrovirus-related pol polyprotein from transposon TNT 1-94 [Tanacetum coccineum]
MKRGSTIKCFWFKLSKWSSMLTEEENSILADPGPFLDTQTLKLSLPRCRLSSDDLDAYDSDKSRSKLLLKEQDSNVVKTRVNLNPINYAVLNNDYNKRFVRQSDLYSEHAYWKATSVTPLDPSPSSTTNKVVKERTTATAITEGTWGFEHTKAYFRDEIIPFIKELKDIFNNFNQYLVEELADVQNVFYQIDQAVEQHCLKSRTFKVKMNQVLSENERLLAQAIDHDIVKTVVNLSVNDGCETVNECQKCLELQTELLNKKDFVDKEIYDKLCKSFTTLEKHCITLEADSQLNQEIFQQTNSVLDQNAPSFTQLFKLSELRAQSQAKDTVIVKLKEQIKSLKGNVDDSKVKMDMDEIETLNIELEHRVTKLVAENEHLKQTYKQLYDSIKPKREQGLVIAALKNELRKLKGKAVDKEAIETHSVDPKVSKDNMEPITPKLLNKRTAHSSYIKHTQEEALVLKDIVEHVKVNYPQDSLLESAFSHTEEKGQERVRLSTSASGSQPSGNTRNDRIQQTPSSNSKNKVEAHPRNVKSSLNKRNSTVQVNGSASVQNSKKHDNSDYVCINGDDYDCMSSDNLCVSNSMNDVQFRAKPKKSKSKKRKSKKNIWKPTGKVFTKIGYIWRPTGRTFTIVGNACPLTRITTTNEVPSRKPIVLESESPKPVVNLVYSRKPRKNKNTESVSKTKVVQIVLWYLDSGCSKHMTGDRSQLTNFISKFLGTVKFGNDQVAKIMGYGDYQIGNVTISRVYYVEGLGHNLFSVGQFCDSNLEVAFRQHTCFIRNLEGVDLLTGSRGDNLYTLSLGNMMASSPICLLSKASKTKSWLWHRRLSHLNFGAINHLARHGLVRGLPKLKFEKDHLCSACALGKSSKKPHKPKSEDTNQEKLYLLHMDLCGPMRVASVNGKKYILVIVDDYSRFTWVKCLRSKDDKKESVNCLAVPLFKQGDDLIDAINKIMSFLSTIVTSHFPSTNNQLRNSSNPRQQATIHDGRISTSKAVLTANLSSYGSNVLSEDTSSSTQQDALILSMFEQLSNQVTNYNKVNNDNLIANETLSVELKRYKEQEKEAQNIDTKIALEKKVKELDNVVCKMGQSAQMLTKPQVFYDNNLKQALGFQNPFYLKKAQQIRPMLYDDNVIAKETNVISIADSEETLMLEEESRSKMLLKQSDPISDEQALHPIINQSASSPVKIEAPRELPKWITPNALTKGECGFEHTKAVFQNEIIPLLKTLKDIFNIFDKDLLNEAKEVQTVFNQMEDAVQHLKLKKIEAELIKQHNMVEKDEYNRLSKRFSELEQHCISLEIVMQLNKEIFQKTNTSVNQTEPSFDQLFELNNLKAELQAKDTTIKKLKARIKRSNETSTSESVKKDFDEIETINIELEHRVTRLIAKNEHLKQTYKQLYDSIKPSRVRAKEQTKSLVNQDTVANASEMSNVATIAPGMYKLDPVILVPKVKNNREAHEYYLKHTMEQAAILREIVEQTKS